MKFIGVLFMTLAVIASPAMVKAEGLLQNPGFEIEGAEGPSKAASWDIWMGERLDEFKHNGSWSLHSWAGDFEGDGGAWYGAPISAGTKVSFQGYIMSPSEGGYHKSPLAGGAEAFLEIEWFQGETKLGSVRSDVVKGACDWKLYTITAVAPEKTDSARFICKVKTVLGSSGDVYFDDVNASIVTK